MLDVELEISLLFLSLKLAKQVESFKQNGDDEFTVFKKISEIMREYEKEKENK